MKKNSYKSSDLLKFRLVFTLVLLPLCMLGQHIDFNNKLDSLIVAKGVPGIQITYMKSPTESYQYNAGYKNYDKKEKVEASSLFQAASMTKTVMAYIVMRLYDKGIIDLDTPLDKYLDYPRLEHKLKGKKMTGRMALIHTIGFPNWTKPRGDSLGIAFEPGTDFLYSGEGYLYLQKVIEKLTNKSLEQLGKEEVFIPFNLNESQFVYKKEIEDEYANGHDDLIPRPLRKTKEPNGAYSLITTSDDYASFVQKAILNGEGLKSDTHKMMLDYSSSRSPRVGYGMGLMMQQDSQGKAIFHTGSNPGFRSFYFTYLDSGEVLVCFTNGSRGDEVRKEVAEMFLGDHNFFGF